MKLNCARCGRDLKKPGGIYRGIIYGPDCLKALGVVTIRLPKAERGALKRKRAVKVEIDQLDLFEGNENEISQEAR